LHDICSHNANQNTCSRSALRETGFVVFRERDSSARLAGYRCLHDYRGAGGIAQAEGHRGLHPLGNRHRHRRRHNARHSAQYPPNPGGRASRVPGDLHTGFADRFRHRTHGSTPRAIGLALVSAVGTERAITNGAPTLVGVVMGIITACFGGIISDLLGQERSIIFSYEIYMTAAMAAAATFVALHSFGLKRELAISASVLIGVAFARRRPALGLVTGALPPSPAPRVKPDTARSRLDQDCVTSMMRKGRS
jgi:Glycine transporter